jgi:ABC-type glycerol-3-phosphate transport system substrate-binding protein
MKKTFLITMISLLLISMIVSFSMVGCKTTSAAAETTTAVAETTAAAETTTTAAASGEKPNLIFWQNEAGSGLSQWYKDVIADINANENFTVTMIENPVADVITKLTTAGVSQSGFDISWDWSGTMSTLARGVAGTYQPVNKLVSNDVLDKLSKDTQVANTDKDGNLWGVPFFLETVYMAYNKSLLEKAGIDTANLPTSFDEFMAMNKKLKDAGIIPISFANKEGLVHEFWVMDMMEQYFNTAAEHKQFWADGKFVGNANLKDAMEKYKAMYDAKYLDPEGESLDYASNYYSRFSSGKVAGIWFINSQYVSAIKDSEIGKDNVIYQKLPFFGNGALKDAIPTLGYCLTIAKWTKYPEQCAKAISYFTSEKWQKEMALKYGVVPAYTSVDVSTATDITPNMKFIFDAGKGKYTEMGYVNFIAGQYDELIRSATSYLHGEINFDDFAKKMEAASTLE